MIDCKSRELPVQLPETLAPFPPPLGDLANDSLQLLLELTRAQVEELQQDAAVKVLFDLIVAYAKKREQFGKPIAQFESVKHMLADMEVGISAARLLVVRLVPLLVRH